MLPQLCKLRPKPSIWGWTPVEMLTAFLSSLKPYAELARIHKPTGWVPGFYCCVMGTTMAATLKMPVTVEFIVRTNSIFLLGSVMFRSLGCTWNDIVDQDIDQQTKRTRSRPLARGAITRNSALLFAVLQLVVGIVVVLQTLPTRCFFLGIPSFLMTVAYPFAKRVTSYPPVVLGLPMCWGIVQAYPALNLDVQVGMADTSFAASCVLFLACTIWTLIYDSIYAAQDLKDDLRNGVGSAVVKHRGGSKVLLARLALSQVALLAGLGRLMNASAIFYLLSCGLTGAALTFLLSRVNLMSTQNCGWGFNFGIWVVGLFMTSGFVAE